MEKIIDIDNKILFSRIVGISLLLMAIIAGVGYGYAFDSFYVADDPFATANHLIENSFFLSLTVISFVAILVLDVIISVGLYVLYKNENKILCLLTSALRLVYSIILGIAIFYLILSSISLNVNPMSEDKIMNNLNSFLKTWSYGLVVFGGHLFALGLLLKKNKAPKYIYVMLLFGGACYFLIHSLEFLLPLYAAYKNTAEMIFALPMALSELMFAAWLVFKRKNYPIN